MNNYEQRVFLNYLTQLIDYMDLDSYTFDNVFSFFLKEFKVDKTLFELDERDELILDKASQFRQFKKTFRRVLNDIQKKMPVRNTSIERKLNILRDIYCLNKDEMVILEFCLLKKLNNVFMELFTSIKGEEMATFTKNVLGMRQGKKDRVIDNLYYRNIITSRRSNYEVSPDILKIFDASRCNDTEKISKMLLGETEKATLNKSDFKHLEKQQKRVVKLLKSAARKKAKGVNILLYGSVGVGKTEFAKLVATLASMPIYAVKTENDEYAEASRDDRLIDLCSKQYILSKCKKSCILFDEAEDVMNRGFSESGSASKGYLNRILENNSVPVIWTTNNIYDVDPAFLRRMTYAIEFEKLSEENRLEIWTKVLKKNNLKVRDSKLEELNKSYDIPTSLIANAVQSTKMIDGNENDFEDFIENVAQIVTKKKNVKIKKNFEAKTYDIKLVNTNIEMSNLTEKIKNAGKFNFSLCLYGEPGTGKSYYAKYLADRLGIEVLFKKASDLISPYVGETEQNIATAFSEAKSKKAMLIFDEADTFLQDRNNAVRSWEVAQVNEMLTQMESAEYPFVCTTNLLDTLDEASLRRFTFKIKFDFMTQEQVNLAVEHFFGIKNASVNLNGLTAGDFATVKKKTDFLGVNNLDEIVEMLKEEIKVKKSKTLQNSVGF